ncbi:MAG: recombinase family protein [Chloroflexota bacterium]
MNDINREQQRAALKRSKLKEAGAIDWQGEHDTDDNRALLEGKLYATYGRDSDVVQVGGTGPIMQDTELEAAAKKYGAIASGLHYFDAFTGTKRAMARSEFARMKSDAKLGRFEFLIVLNESRWSRWAVDGMAEIRELNEMGIWVLFVGDKQLCPLTKSWSTTVGHALLLAQQESEQKSRTIRLAWAAKQLLKLATGKPPFGVRWIETPQLSPRSRKQLKTWAWDDVPDSVTERYACQPIDLLYQWFKDGERHPGMLAKRLNDAGYKTALGNDWTEQSVRDVMTHPILIGRKVYNPGTERECVLQLLEPRVSEAWYNQVIEFYRDRSTGKRADRRQDVVHLFTGVSRCGACERPYNALFTKVSGRASSDDVVVMAKKKAKGEENGEIEWITQPVSVFLGHSPSVQRRIVGQSDKPECHEGSVRESEVSRAVATWLLALSLPDGAQAYIEAAAKSRSANQGGVEDAAAKRASINDEIERCHKSYRVGGYKSGGSDGFNVYQSEIKDLERKLGEIPAHLDRSGFTPTPVEFDELAEAAAKFLDPSVSRGAKRRLVDSIFEKLVIVRVGTKKQYNNYTIDWNRSVVLPRYADLVHACFVADHPLFVGAGPMNDTDKQGLDRATDGLLEFAEAVFASKHGDRAQQVQELALAA